MARLKGAVKTTKETVKKSLGKRNNALENLEAFLVQEAEKLDLPPDQIDARIETRPQGLSLSLWAGKHWVYDLAIIDLVRVFGGSSATLLPGIKDRVKGSVLRGLQDAAKGYQLPTEAIHFRFKMQGDRVGGQVYHRSTFINDLDLDHLMGFFL